MRRPAWLSGSRGEVIIFRMDTTMWQGVYQDGVAAARGMGFWFIRRIFCEKGGTGKRGSPVRECYFLASLPAIIRI